MFALQGHAGKVRAKADQVIDQLEMQVWRPVAVARRLPNGRNHLPCCDGLTLADKIRELLESGVVLLIGTDSGVPLNFHSDATWRELELPELEVVLVNTAETEDEVFLFLGIVAPDLLPLMDIDGQVTEVWQPRGLPATYLVDPVGNIQYQALGGREWDKPVYLEFLRGLSTPASADK